MSSACKRNSFQTFRQPLHLIRDNHWHRKGDLWALEARFLSPTAIPNVMYKRRAEWCMLCLFSSTFFTVLSCNCNMANGRWYCPNNISFLKDSNMYWSTNTSYWPNNISSLKRSNMCWTVNCRRYRAAICIGRPIHHPDSATICIDDIHMALEFNNIYKTYWYSYRTAQCVVYI